MWALQDAVWAAEAGRERLAERFRAELAASEAALLAAVGEVRADAAAPALLSDAAGARRRRCVGDVARARRVRRMRP